MTGPFRAAPADEHLARRLAWQLAILLVHDLRFEAATGTTERARVNHPRLVGDERDASGLGHAPRLQEREAEPLLERLVKLWLDAGADAEFHTMLALLGDDGLVEEQRWNDAEVMHDRRARGEDVLPPARRAEALRQDEAVRREHRARRRQRLAVHVEQRQRVEEAVAARLDDAEAAEVAIPRARVQVVQVGQDAA